MLLPSFGRKFARLTSYFSDSRVRSKIAQTELPMDLQALVAASLDLIEDSTRVESCFMLLRL
ncbi:hypothetical protein TIFTF001_002664 [Ficus carica]|uniref:Uncharacterized protein n=1 Tax=Ficus carica TaxID=3494 RepID=A0AA87Z5Q9_FICCA|nr:hypothetical protein TIFTF001_002664 [Ficus carica]